MTSSLVQQLNSLFANTYSLYLKTQSYHWHVKGALFYPLHKLLEEQYENLSDAIDRIAERIVQLGGEVVATLDGLKQNTSLAAAKPKSSATEMLSDLLHDHRLVLKQLNEILTSLPEEDGATDNVICDRQEDHGKMIWMLEASLQK